MASNPVITAPILSTQTDGVFPFHKYKEEVHDRSFYLGPNWSENLKEKITQYYDIPELINFFLKNTNYENITLQFPDHLVMDSSIVVQLLQEGLPNIEIHEENQVLPENIKISEQCCKHNFNSLYIKPNNNVRTLKRHIWVLADSAYSPCCVDEIAAEHVNSDIIVHFGDACLNAIQKLPVIYSFGKPYINLNDIIQSFTKTYSDKSEKICLMSNTPYIHCLNTLYNELKELGYINLLYTDIDEKLINKDVKIIGYEYPRKFGDAYNFDNRMIISDKKINIQDDCNSFSEVCLFYITIPSPPHLLYLITKFQSVTLYNPQDASVMQGPFPSITKRYRFMHLARTAGTIGILINTLSLKKTNDLINKLTDLIKKNGKKHYMFVVGKPNVAKLANFDSIDIWCILGCGQGGIILDEYNEFYKPIITPYELILALNPESIWVGKWIIDFKQVLDEIDQEMCKLRNKSTLDGDETDVPEFNPATGKYVSTSRPLRNIKYLEIESSTENTEEINSQQLVGKFSGSLLIQDTISTSAAHLQSRYWSGLGSDFMDNKVDENGADLEEGAAGMPREYHFGNENI